MMFATLKSFQAGFPARESRWIHLKLLSLFYFLLLSFFTLFSAAIIINLLNLWTAEMWYWFGDLF